MHGAIACRANDLTGSHAIAHPRLRQESPLHEGGGCCIMPYELPLWVADSCAMSFSANSGRRKTEKTNPARGGVACIIA
jgi:hypothetical protein